MGYDPFTGESDYEHGFRVSSEKPKGTVMTGLDDAAHDVTRGVIPEFDRGYDDGKDAREEPDDDSEDSEPSGEPDPSPGGSGSGGGSSGGGGYSGGYSGGSSSSNEGMGFLGIAALVVVGGYLLLKGAAFLLGLAVSFVVGLFSLILPILAVLFYCAIAIGVFLGLIYGITKGVEHWQSSKSQARRTSQRPVSQKSPATRSVVSSAKKDETPVWAYALGILMVVALACVPIGRVLIIGMAIIGGGIYISEKWHEWF